MKSYLTAIVLGLITIGGTSQPAAAQMSRPTAPASATYSVYYYNVKTPKMVHHYGTYSSYASALRAVKFVNSYPQYRAYFRTNASHN